MWGRGGGDTAFVGICKTSFCTISYSRYFIRTQGLGGVVVVVEGGGSFTSFSHV